VVEVVVLVGHWEIAPLLASVPHPGVGRVVVVTVAVVVVVVLVGNGGSVVVVVGVMKASSQATRPCCLQARTSCRLHFPRRMPVATHRWIAALQSRGHRAAHAVEAARSTRQVKMARTVAAQFALLPSRAVEASAADRDAVRLLADVVPEGLGADKCPGR